MTTIQIEPAKAAVTVTVSEDEVRRVVKALGAKKFSICWNLDAMLDDAPVGCVKDEIRDTVSCENAIVDELIGS